MTESEFPRIECVAERFQFGITIRKANCLRASFLGIFLLVLSSGCAPVTWQDKMERLASELPSFEPEPEYLLDFARQAGGEPSATGAEYRRFFWDGTACGNAIVLEKKSADSDETFYGGVLFQTVLGRTIRIAMAVRAILDSDGRLLSYETLQRVGEDSKRTRALFRAEDTLWIETEEGATRSEKEVVFSRRALTTDTEIRKHFEAGGLAAGTSFRSVSSDCFAEKVDSKEVVLGPLEVIDILGKRTDVRSLSSNCVEPGCDLRGYTVDRTALAIGCGLSEGGDCGNGWMALENLQVVDVRLHDRE